MSRGKTIKTRNGRVRVMRTRTHLLTLDKHGNVLSAKTR